MTTLLLIISICLFLFYGVVGADKTWIEGPALFLIYALITIAMVKRALGAGRKTRASRGWRTEVGGLRTEGGGRRTEGRGRVADFGSPISGGLWMLFLLYGIFLIPQAAVYFESKLTMLLIGGVVGAYLVWGRALQSFRVCKPLLGTLIFVVMLAALYGLIVHFKCPDWVLWSKRYAVYEGRLMSTYICPNHFAHLLQMLLPFCLVLLFIPQAGLYLRLLSGYSLLVFIPPLFLTESRAGWLGSIAAVGVTLLLLAFRRSKKLFLLLMVLVPLCSAILLFSAWRFSETFQRRMTPVVKFLEGQVEEGLGSEARDFRPQTWMDTIDMIKEKPWFGYGPGTYRYAYPEFRKRFRGNRVVTGHPHNEYLELMADFGWVGFGLFALAWLYGCIRILVFSLKTDNQKHAFMALAFLGTVAGTMVHSFFDFQMHILPNALVFAFLAAVAVGPMVAAKRVASGEPKAEGGERRTEDEGRRLENRGRRLEDGALDASGPLTSDRRASISVALLLNKALLWMLAIFFLIGTVFCAQVMGSAYLRAWGDRAAANKDLERAAHFYGLATKLDDSNWRIYKSQGQLAYEERYYSIDQAEKPELAKLELGYYASAYAANPLDPEIISAFAHANIFTGATEEGLQLLRDACRYRTFNDKYWWNLGVALRKVGQYEEALDVFKHAQRLNNSVAIRANIKWIEGARKRRDQKTEVRDQPLEDGVPRSDISWDKEAGKEIRVDDLDELLNLMGK